MKLYVIPSSGFRQTKRQWATVYNIFGHFCFGSGVITLSIASDPVVIKSSKNRGEIKVYNDIDVVLMMAPGGHIKWHVVQILFCKCLHIFWYGG